MSNHVIIRRVVDVEWVDDSFTAVQAGKPFNHYYGLTYGINDRLFDDPNESKKTLKPDKTNDKTAKVKAWANVCVTCGTR